jgi:hypothetical protein
MLFFRSEEHLKNWAQYKPGTEAGISQLDGLLTLFSSDLFKRRMEKDYLSNMKKYTNEFINKLGSTVKIGDYFKS